MTATDFDRAPFSLSPYDELISILDSLPVLVREKRRRLGLSLRAAADEIGMSAPTIQRCEAGQKEVSLTNATILLRWVGTDR
jgi:ribosome-binding protein aMBF1 (putative translation factor)